MIRFVLIIGIMLSLVGCVVNPEPEKLTTHTITCYCDYYLETCICGGRVYNLQMNIQAEIETMPDL